MYWFVSVSEIHKFNWKKKKKKKKKKMMKHESLVEYLRGESCSLKLPQLISMSAQVASSMAYLEELNYPHQDVAARNILVDEEYICK